MTEEEIAAFAHRNVVTRALGSKEAIEPTVLVEPLERGDVYLVCSDGLWGSVADEHMRRIVGSTPDIEAACQLPHRRRQRGGRSRQHHGRARESRLTGRG